MALAFDMIYKPEVKVEEGVHKVAGKPATVVVEQTERFKRRILHLVTLQHAMCLLSLRAETEDMNRKESVDVIEKFEPESIADAKKDEFRLAVIGGISEDERNALMLAPQIVPLVKVVLSYSKAYPSHLVNRAAENAIFFSALGRAHSGGTIQGRRLPSTPTSAESVRHSQSCPSKNLGVVMSCFFLLICSVMQTIRRAGQCHRCVLPDLENLHTALPIPVHAGHTTLRPIHHCHSL